MAKRDDTANANEIILAKKSTNAVQLMLLVKEKSFRAESPSRQERFAPTHQYAGPSQ